MNKSAVIRGYLDRFRDISTRSLARKIYKENCALFTDYEAARYAIRYVRGECGEYLKQRIPPDHRKYISAKSVPIPASLDNGRDWGPFVIQGPVRAGILSDIHVPYHDDDVIGLAIKHLKDKNVDLIILNGDTFDYHGLSKFQKDPRLIDFPEEIRQGKEFLAAIRSMFPKARIIFKWGNHDTRFESYLIQKAPELLDVPEFQISSICQFDQLDIEEVKDDRPIVLGKLNVIHGHEYHFSISNPVGAARGVYLRAGVHTLCGHFHQTSSYSKRNLEGKVISCFSTGCLCQFNPEYRRLADWGHGFAYCEVDKHDAFSVHNYRIFDGKIFE